MTANKLNAWVSNRRLTHCSLSTVFATSPPEVLDSPECAGRGVTGDVSATALVTVLSCDVIADVAAAFTLADIFSEGEIASHVTTVWAEVGTAAPDVHAVTTPFKFRSSGHGSLAVTLRLGIGVTSSLDVACHTDPGGAAGNTCRSSATCEALTTPTPAPSGDLNTEDNP